MKLKFIVSISLLSFCIPALAVVLGGSNLSLSQYPEPSCSKPYSKPYKPYQFNSQFELDNYNREVGRYNEQVKRYSECIDEYLENANNDIKRIKEAAQEAIDEFNSL